MATGVCRDKRSVDCLVLCYHKQNRKGSAKSVTMRATAICKNLSGYKELFLINKMFPISCKVTFSVLFCIV